LMIQFQEYALERAIENYESGGGFWGMSIMPIGEVTIIIGMAMFVYSIILFIKEDRREKDEIIRIIEKYENGREEE